MEPTLQGKINMSNNKGDDHSMRDPLELEREMEKRKIREEIIRRSELEAEVRMELLLEYQRNFNGFLSDYHHCGPLHSSGFLGFHPSNDYSCNYDYFRPDLCQNFGEEMKFGAESMRIGPHPVENYGIVREGEKQQVQEGGKQGFERNPSSVAVGFARMSDAEIAQVERSSEITGMKRKAETPARACDGDTVLPLNEGLKKKWFCSLCEVSTTSEVTLNAHLQGRKHKAKEGKSKSNAQGSRISMDIDVAGKPKRLAEPDSTPTSGQVKSKWECSLCQLFVSSEILLKSHLTGKKHKAKEAKLQTDQSISSVEECSIEKFGELADHSGNANATDAINKWYCSLCEVLVFSEKNLNDHIQGKKHKAKAVLAHQNSVDLDSPSIENEAIKIMKKENCNRGENAKEEQQTKCPSTEVGKDEVSGQELTEVEANRSLALQATADTNKLESVNIDGNEQETRVMASQTSKETAKHGNPSIEFVKYWHCKLCDKGTPDEATMIAHRRSDEHKALMRKNGGSLICVSNVAKEASLGKVYAVTSS